MGCMPCHYFSLRKSCKRLHFPNMGTFYSQHGNNLFPTWELFIPSLGTFSNLCAKSLHSLEITYRFGRCQYIPEGI